MHLVYYINFIAADSRRHNLVTQCLTSSTPLFEVRPSRLYPDTCGYRLTAFTFSSAGVAVTGDKKQFTAFAISFAQVVLPLSRSCEQISVRPECRPLSDFSVWWLYVSCEITSSKVAERYHDKEQDA